MKKSKGTARRSSARRSKRKKMNIPNQTVRIVNVFASIFILMSLLTELTGKAGEFARLLFVCIFSGFSIPAALFMLLVSIAGIMPRFREADFLKRKMHILFFAGAFIIYATTISGGYPSPLPVSSEGLSNVIQSAKAGEGSGLIGETVVSLLGNYLGVLGNILAGVFMVAVSCVYGMGSPDWKAVGRILKNRIKKNKRDSKKEKIQSSKGAGQVSNGASKAGIEIIGFDKAAEGEQQAKADRQTVKIETACTIQEKLNSKNEEAGAHAADVELLYSQDMSSGKFEGYTLPGTCLMSKSQRTGKKDDKKDIMKNIELLEKTLMDFGVEAKVNQVSVGPAITRYELQPKSGVKVSKIVNLSDDIALNLAAASIRIEAPIPGKSAVGIEVPNSNVEMVTLGDIIDSGDFRNSDSKLSFALGKDISGAEIVTDISKMPHMLIAGATGSGKSVCVNSLIMSILYKARPDEVKFIMIDPKVVELSIYNDIPHLLIPVVTDPQKAAMALGWAVNEMTKRYNLFAKNSVKDIEGYNSKSEEKLPKIVVIIDELADLMISSPKDVEDSICRLAQMARAAGMHLIIATQRPSVDVITGVIKANIPSRIAFAVSSQMDSRTILDMGGAEKLLGKGDMLFYPVGYSKPQRIQGAFISESEIQSVVEYVKSQDFTEKAHSEEIMRHMETAKIQDEEFADEIMDQAIEYVIESKQASASMLQRKFRIGFNRAARIIDQMESKGIIGPSEGSKARKVLVSANNMKSEGDQIEKQ